MPLHLHTKMIYALCALMSWPVTRWIRYEPKAKYRRSRPLCHNWGFVCAWRGSIAYVKAWQHYPRTHVGHRRACTVLLIGVRAVYIQDARRLSAYMAHLPERMCSVSYVHYIRAADQIFSILNFQNAAEKKSRQMRAFVWEFLRVPSLHREPFHLCAYYALCAAAHDKIAQKGAAAYVCCWCLTQKR